MLGLNTNFWLCLLCAPVCPVCTARTNSEAQGRKQAHFTSMLQQDM